MSHTPYARATWGKIKGKDLCFTCVLTRGREKKTASGDKSIKKKKERGGEKGRKKERERGREGRKQGRKEGRELIQ